MKKILILSPYNPFTKILGANDIILRDRLKLLSSQFEISIITFSKEESFEKKQSENFGVKAIFIPYPKRKNNEKRNIINKIISVLSGKLSVFDNWESHSEALTVKALDLLKTNSFDLIHFETTLAFSRSLKWPVKIKKTVFCDNIYSVIYERIYKNKILIKEKIIACMEYFWIYRFEKKTLAQFDHAVVLSPIEGERAKRLNPKLKLYEVPLSVDTNKLLPDPSCSQKEFPTLVFTGTMSYEPNEQAIIYFAKDIFPSLISKFPKIKLYVVGKDPGEKIKQLSSKNMIITGAVDSISTYVYKANIIIVPIQIGGGMRLKILEAFSFGKAVISTSTGAEGIKYTNNQNIMVADTEKEFIEKIEYLLSNRSQIKMLGENARKLAQKEYSVQSIAGKWASIFNQLIIL